MRCTPLSRPFLGQNKLGSRASLGFFCPRELWGSSSAMVDRCRCPITQGLMEPLLVVERNVSCHMLARVPHALVVSPIDLLICDRPPQPLHEHVVQGPAAAVHADTDPSFLQPRRQLPTGELRPLVGVEDLRLAPAQRV